MMLEFIISAAIVAVFLIITEEKEGEK